MSEEKKKPIYSETIQVYDGLGEKYFNDSLLIVPENRDEFAGLIPKGGNVLDVGCGGGRDAQYFTDQGFCVTGIDLSSVMIDYAKQLIPNAEFHVMDVVNINLPEHNYDAIWAQAVLLHLERKDVPKVLDKFYELLRPEGVLHIQVKLGSGTAYVSEKLSGFKERFYTYFSKEEMQKLVTDAGFSIISSVVYEDPIGREGVEWISIDCKK
jgi:SAM-dependent methyltransferase